MSGNKDTFNNLMRSGARYGTRYAAKRTAQTRENGKRKNDPITAGIAMTVVGGLMLILSGQLGALPLLLAGVVTLGFGAGMKRRKKEAQDDAEQPEFTPKTSAGAKKLAEQKQFLESGLIDAEEYRENCAKIHARERYL